MSHIDVWAEKDLTYEGLVAYFEELTYDPPDTDTYLNITDDKKKRILYEIGLIKNRGYSIYFKDSAAMCIPFTSSLNNLITEEAVSEFCLKIVDYHKEKRALRNLYIGTCKTEEDVIENLKALSKDTSGRLVRFKMKEEGKKLRDVLIEPRFRDYHVMITGETKNHYVYENVYQKENFPLEEAAREIWLNKNQRALYTGDPGRRPEISYSDDYDDISYDR